MLIRGTDFSSLLLATWNTKPSKSIFDIELVNLACGCWAVAVAGVRCCLHFDLWWFILPQFLHLWPLYSSKSFHHTENWQNEFS